MNVIRRDGKTNMRTSLLIGGAFSFGMSIAAAAQTAPAPDAPDNGNLTTNPALPAPSEQDLAHQIAQLNWIDGPSAVKIANVSTFNIPQNYEMLVPPDSVKFLQLNGNTTSDGDNGDFILQNDDPKSGWFAILVYEDAGHISDTETIDPDALLSAMQSYNARDNADRQKQGIPTMNLEGWAIKPSYDPQSHRLEWAFDFNNSDGTKTVNLNTRILGRAGDLKIIVVDDPDALKADLADFNHAMTGFTFDPGQTYGDYRQGDHLASYGLAALIGGAGVAVAAKTGLLAGAFALLAGAGKAILGAMAAVIAVCVSLFRKLFRRGRVK
jgi:uncharacterized membrane-anchored protein